MSALGLLAGAEPMSEIRFERWTIQPAFACTVDGKLNDLNRRAIGSPCSPWLPVSWRSSAHVDAHPAWRMPQLAGGTDLAECRVRRHDCRRLLCLSARPWVLRVAAPPRSHVSQ